jgi:hypothetical protein
MLTVVNFHKRKTKDNRDFLLLELQGGLEMVQSQTTGKFYATIRKCFLPTTFDEGIAKSLLGSQIPGKVVRVESDPYEFVVKNSGEVITLTHRWSYQPEHAATPQLVPAF